MLQFLYMCKCTYTRYKILWSVLIFVEGPEGTGGGGEGVKIPFPSAIL